MSLITDGFTLLGNLKVPAVGGATSSDTPLLIKNADFTAAMIASLKADGGDLRISTDSAGLNRLPLDVVDNLDVIWTLVPSVAVDTLIYIWGNKPAAVKEIDTSTYGRNAVYVDEINRFHMNGELGNLTDSKGVEDATKFGTPVLGSNIAGYGSSVNFNAATRYTLSDPFSGRTTFSACGWINKTAQSGSSQGVLGAWNGNTEMSVLVFNGSNDNFLVRVANSSGSFVTCTTATEFFDGTPKWWYVEYDGSNVRLYVNNILQDTQSLTGNVDTTVTPFEFGRYGLDDIRLWPSSQQEVSFRPTTTSSNQRSIEYQNQSANDAWWIAEDAANDLGTQGFTLLGTLKVPSLGTGVTSSNTPLLIKAADLTTAMVNNLKADWGDLRLSTDSAGNNQLPLDIPATDLAWTRLTSVAADDVIYIWGNKPAAVKEIDTATYGRNAVWQDYLAVLHLNENTWEDSTGNGYNGTATGTPTVTTNNHPFGSSWMELSSGVAEYLTLASSSGILDSLPNAHVSAIIYKIGEQNGGIISNRDSSQGDNFQQLSSRESNPAGFNSVFHDGTGGSSVTTGSNDGATGTSFLTQSWDTTNIELYINSNETLVSTMAGDGQLVTTKPMVVGSYFTFSAALSFTGYIGEVRIASFQPTPNQISIEYQNQSANDAWWIAEDAGGGELTINLSPLVSTVTFYTPTVLKDKLVTLDTVVSTEGVYEPVILKDKLITLDNISSTEAVYQPSLLQEHLITPSNISSTATVYNPSVLKAKLIELQQILSGSSVYTPGLLKDKLLTLNQILTTAVVYDPVIKENKFLFPEFISSTEVLFDVEVIGGFRPVPEVKLYTAEGYGLHVRSAAEMKSVIEGLIKRIEILEGH